MTTGTLTTYAQVGKKEDISDIITNISPTKTPFQAMIGSESIHNTLHQWQEDSLASVTSSPTIEGADAPNATSAPTVMRNNTTQIFTKTAKASGTTDAVKAYGRAKELAYQLKLRSAEVKRDFENTLVGIGSAQVAVTGSTSVARQMNGAQAQIDATVVYTMGNGLNNTSGSPTAATITEASFLTTLQQLYIDGAEPTTLMVKPADKTAVSAWSSSSRTVMVNNGQKTLTNSIDVYDSPFGKISVVINRFLKSTDALIFEGAMWKKLVLRNWFRETLAKTGDSTNVQILGEFSLKHANYLASGLITNLT
jgi:hypothetical protein